MSLQLLLNLVIAVVWMFLFNDWSLSRFAGGFVIGLIGIGLLSRFWPQGFYMRRLWAVVRLLALFAKELFLSSWAVMRHIVRPKLDFRPGIFALRTELKSDWEITLLSCLICLTPGTLTLDVGREGDILYIHAMDIEDAEALSEQIKGTFEKAIREVTR